MFSLTQQSCFVRGTAQVSSSSDLLIQRGNEVALSMEKKTDAKTLETHAEVRSSSGRKIQMRIVAKDQNSRPSLDELSEFKKSDSDTGSASLQIALLTKRIENLTAHLQANRKDYSTQRGLKLLLGRRGRLQKYLAKEDPAKYQMTMKGLGLKIKSV